MPSPPKLSINTKAAKMLPIAMSPQTSTPALTADTPSPIDLPPSPASSVKATYVRSRPTSYALSDFEADAIALNLETQIMSTLQADLSKALANVNFPTQGGNSKNRRPPSSHPKPRRAASIASTATTATYRITRRDTAEAAEAEKAFADVVAAHVEHAEAAPVAVEKPRRQSLRSLKKTVSKALSHSHSKSEASASAAVKSEKAKAPKDKVKKEDKTKEDTKKVDKTKEDTKKEDTIRRRATSIFRRRKSMGISSKDVFPADLAAEANEQRMKRSKSFQCLNDVDDSMFPHDDAYYDIDDIALESKTICSVIARTYRYDEEVPESEVGRAF